MVVIVCLGVKWDVHLLQEIVKWLDQVVDEIELVVVHLWRHDYRRRALDPRLQSLRVSEADQLVTLPMYKESWALDLRHNINVAKAVIYQVL